jgi:hypothetical protein
MCFLPRERMELREDWEGIERERQREDERMNLSSMFLNKEE